MGEEGHARRLALPAGRAADIAPIRRAHHPARVLHLDVQDHVILNIDDVGLDSDRWLGSCRDQCLQSAGIRRAGFMARPSPGDSTVVLDTHEKVTAPSVRQADDRIDQLAVVEGRSLLAF